MARRKLQPRSASGGLSGEFVSVPEPVEGTIHEPAPLAWATSLGDFAERDRVRCRLSFVRLLQRIEAESARSRAVKRQRDLLRSKLLPLAIPPNPPAPVMTVSYIDCWCARRGSNPQPPDSKSGALSVELRAPLPVLIQQDLRVQIGLLRRGRKTLDAACVLNPSGKAALPRTIGC
jgi:hypothetical protein